jgi:hypothetical protein
MSTTLSYYHPFYRVTLVNRVKRLLAAISVSTGSTMFTKMWKMPSGRDIAKEYQSRSRWLKQLNATVNGGADSHEDY